MGDAKPGDGVCDTARNDDREIPPSGICSLRAAIDEADADALTDIIDFKLPGIGVQTIISNGLTARQPVRIDARTQPGYSGTPLIQLQGGAVSLVGLQLEGAGSLVAGFAINGFSASGLVIFGDATEVVSNYIGTDPTGSSPRPNGEDGIVITANNVIVGLPAAAERNVISGNSRFGIQVEGQENVIQGNYIGTDASGGHAVANGLDGIHLFAGPENIIGGVATGSENTISGNGRDGIRIGGPAVFNTTIAGNLIGTNAAGAEPVGNVGAGVTILGETLSDPVVDNVIGGDNPRSRNVISGNLHGIVITGEGTDRNRVQGNYIGTDQDGTRSLGNQKDGVLISFAGCQNTIGGAEATMRNTISGNGDNGVRVSNTVCPSTRQNLIQGNFIGTDKDGRRGDAGVGNAGRGVVVESSAGVLTGGDTKLSEFGFPAPGQAPGNVIANNSQGGILVSGGTSTKNAVAGNLIGLEADGATPLGNSGDGIELSAASETTIGGTSVAGRNVISANSGNGIHIHQTSASLNKVQANYIGTGISGSRPDSQSDLGNAKNGIKIDSSAKNTIGGAPSKILGLGTAPGNIVADNGENGLEIHGVAADNNVVQGNLIGVDVSGFAALGNALHGISLVDAPSTMIGGEEVSSRDTTTRNVVSGNQSSGIRILGVAARKNTVQGNFIGTASDGKARLGNLQHGVFVADTTDTLIGGTESTTAGKCEGVCNVIAYNGSSLETAGHGVVIKSGTRHTVRRNSIHSNAGLGIDLGPNGVTPNDVVKSSHSSPDADAGANQLLNFPVGVAYSQKNGEFTISGLIVTEKPKEVTVDFYASRDVDPSGFGEGELYLGSVEPEGVVTGGAPDPGTTGAFALTLSKTIADELVSFPYVSATVTSTEGSTSEFSPVCGPGTDDDGDPDSDKDGLCDDWETNGIDFDGDGVVEKTDTDGHNGITSADGHVLHGANPRRKDIFVEIDWMRPLGRVNPKPSPSALAEVASAFENAPTANADGTTGITLHLQMSELLPTQDVISFQSREPLDRDDYFDLKLGSNDSGNVGEVCGNFPADGHFGQPADRADEASCAKILGARRLAFRYAVFGHAFTEDPSAAGLADLQGNDLLVTPGAYSEAAIKSAGGRYEFDAATLMHELGHTLGLVHGGGDLANCKPNYLSVMNHSLLFKNMDTMRPLDFSRQKLADLNERQLSEVKPLPTAPEDRKIVFGTGGIPTLATPANGDINWDDVNGIKQNGPVEADINLLAGLCGDARLQTLSGFDDWMNLDFDFRDSIEEYADDPALSNAPGGPSGAQVLALAGAVDFDGDGLSNADDNCPAVTNPDQADVGGDGIGDVCEVDLSVNQSDAADPVPPGEELSYILSVRNEGVLQANSVVLTDELPAGADLVSATSTQGLCTAFGQIVTCDLGDLASGAEAMITIRATVSTTGTFTNVATIDTLELEPDYTNNSTTETTTVSDTDIGLLSFATHGSLSQLAVTYEIQNQSAPEFEVGFFISDDARFDAADSEIGSRVVVVDAADRVPGSHRLEFDRPDLDTALIDIETLFLLAVVDPDRIMDELDEFNNDQNFVGVFHQPASPSPVVIRGHDPGSRNASDAADEVRFLSDGLQSTVALNGTPHRVPSADISIVLVRTAGGDDTIETDSAQLLVVRAGSGNDALVLDGNLDLIAMDDGALTEIETIDIRGSGANILRLDVEEVREISSASNELFVMAGLDDQVAIGDGWTLPPGREAAFFNDVFFRRLEQDGATLFLNGPANWQNPLVAFDVNSDGVSATPAGDILPLINELNFENIVGDTGDLPEPTSQFAPPLFYDVNGDGLLTSVGDILPLINEANQETEAEFNGRIPISLLSDANRDGSTPIFSTGPEAGNSAELLVWARPDRPYPYGIPYLSELRGKENSASQLVPLTEIADRKMLDELFHALGLLSKMGRIMAFPFGAISVV